MQFFFISNTIKCIFVLLKYGIMLVRLFRDWQNVCSLVLSKDYSKIMEDRPCVNNPSA